MEFITANQARENYKRSITANSEESQMQLEYLNDKISEASTDKKRIVVQIEPTEQTKTVLSNAGYIVKQFFDDRNDMYLDIKWN